MRQFFHEIIWEKKIFVFACATTILILLGPFGTYDEMTLDKRFVYWSVLMIGIGVLMNLFISLAMVSSYLPRMPALMRIAVGSALAAIPSLAILIFVNDIYRPGISDNFDLPLKWVQITSIGIMVSALDFLDWRLPAKPTPAEIETIFHKRLAPKIGRDIVSASMQDHYVEVTTALGKDMILIRFSDALDELEGLAGARVHRSHWVAAAHLERLAKDGARHRAVLSDGRSLPVSATYLEAAEQLLAQQQAGK